MVSQVDKASVSWLDSHALFMWKRNEENFCMKSAVGAKEELHTIYLFELPMRAYQEDDVAKKLKEVKAKGFWFIPNEYT